MIKKVFAISLILFFGFTGNTYAIELPSGNVFGDDTIPIPITEIVPPISYPRYTYIKIFNDLGISVENQILSSGCMDAYVGTWKELLGENYESYLNRDFHILNTTSGACYDKNDECCFNYSQVKLRDIGWYLPVVIMPETASSDLLANVGGLFTDFWPIIAMMFGIPLAFYIIPRVIELVVVRDKS